MPSSNSARNRTGASYSDACDALEAALAGDIRNQILDALESSGDFARAWQGLRSAMRSHVFPTAAKPLSLHRVVQTFDTRARRAGLHVLESWDYRAHRFADEILPVLMLDRCAIHGVPAERRRAALAVLLDHYFLAVLGLLAVQAWGEGDPNENLDRITRLLQRLNNGASGTGFVDDAETLILVAISHYHPEESAYDKLLAEVATLSDAHQLRLALACSATLGSHLRWGLHFMYRRDVGRMREDNVVDYPWLVFSLITLWRESLRLRDANGTGADRERVAEGLLNGLSADPWLAIGNTPAWLQYQREEHAELREGILNNRDTLIAGLESHEPRSSAYSPLGLGCNFLCNSIVAMVATALIEPGPHAPLNALFSRAPLGGWASADAERQARRLMAYARAGAPHPQAPALIVYDPRDAAHFFNMTCTVLRGSTDRVATTDPGKVSIGL